MINDASKDGGRDDLDLSVVLERFIIFLRHSRTTILVWTLSGLLLGIAYYLITPKQYRSNTLLHSYTFTNTEQIKIIENWNELLKKGEHRILSNIFTASEDDVKKINSIKAAEIQKLYIPNNPNGFLAEAEVKDYMIFDSLQAWMMRGFEHEPFIKEKMLSKRNNLRDLINTTGIEISKLDTAKSRIEENFSKGIAGNNSFILDISGINTQKIALQEKLLGYKDELKFTAPVQILHPFEKFTKPSSPKLLKSVVLGILFGLAIGYLLSVYKYLRSKGKS